MFTNPSNVYGACQMGLSVVMTWAWASIICRLTRGMATMGRFGVT